MHIAGDTFYVWYHSNCADSARYKNLQTVCLILQCSTKIFLTFSKAILFMVSGKKVQIKAVNLSGAILVLVHGSYD